MFGLTEQREVELNDFSFHCLDCLLVYIWNRFDWNLVKWNVFFISFIPIPQFGRQRMKRLLISVCIDFVVTSRTIKFSSVLV